VATVGADSRREEKSLVIKRHRDFTVTHTASVGAITRHRHPQAPAVI
jgi:hypothetical protein